MSEYVVNGVSFEEMIVEEGEDVHVDTTDDDDDVELVGDDDFLASMESSNHKDFLARKGDWCSASLAKMNDVNVARKDWSGVDDEDILEELLIVDDEIYEEQVIEKWFQADSLPDDLESACRRLIPIVYSGEDHADPETMMRRTPLRELYKYLKQHYDYKKDIRKEECEESLQEVECDIPKQPILQELFRLRVLNTRAHHDVLGAIVSGRNVTGKSGDLQKRESGEECEDNESESNPREVNVRDTFANEDKETNDAGNLRAPTGTSFGDGNSKSIAEENYALIFEENSVYTSTLPDRAYEYVTEEILEGSSTVGFNYSLHDLGGSMRSYTEEVIEGYLSTRSFVEEVVIEESEESPKEKSGTTVTLPDNPLEHVGEEILQESNKFRFDGSLYEVGGNTRLYSYEDGDLSARSFLEEVVIEESEVSIEEKSDCIERFPSCFVGEEILEESNKICFDCSLHDMGGSARLYAEEYAEGGLSTRSFMEEVVIE
jgi:hypothetical protein